jgi:RNA polymerase sigma-70 factor (ECF subfamily)
MKRTRIQSMAIAAALSFLATSAGAVDLLAHYPTTLAAGDAQPDHARAWEFTPEDIFQVSHFALQVGDQLKVETGAGDLGVGHCADGAVWAVLIPRTEGTLTSPVADQGEAIANVWLRFHPAQINQLFPPATVSGNGDTNLISQIKGVVNAKFHSSWHAGDNAMIPEPQDVTVYVDTKAGAHRFFMVDTAAKTAEYVAAFNQRSSSFADISPKSVPPVVVKTVPESGSTDIPPGECEIKVTFSKEMTDHSWSWCTVWDNSTPESIGDPQYDADHKTCVMKAKLEPGQTYGYWLNTEKFHNFKDTQGRPAVPYLLVFQTQSTGAPPRLAAGSMTNDHPRVVSVSPADGATDVELTQDLRVRFDQPMRPGNIALQWQSGGFSSDGAFRYEPAQNEFVIPLRLLPGQTNKVGLNIFDRGGFRSLAGPAAKEFHWQFTTKPAAATPDAAKPKAVGIAPGAESPLPVLTMLQVTFDQPMRPPEEGFPFLEKSPFADVPGVIHQFGYEPLARRFTIPLVLPPDNPVKLVLKGFCSAAGAPADPVIIRRDIGTNDFSAGQAKAIADAAADPRLKQLLAAMKEARQRLASGVETVRWEFLNGEESWSSFRVNQAVFKWQGTNQALGDISDVMNSKAFVLGIDGTNCWLFGDGDDGQSLQSCPAALMADINLNIADPFALASRPLADVIAEEKLIYAGQAQLAGRTCYRLQSWTVDQARGNYGRTSAECREWWIDAASDLPVQLIESATYGCQIYSFNFDHLNELLPDNTFAPPAVTSPDPKAEQYKLFKQQNPAPDEKRFITIRDGGDGRMSGRLGRNDSSGRTSSGLN